MIADIINLVGSIFFSPYRVPNGTHFFIIFLPAVETAGYPYQTPKGVSF